MKKIRLNTMMFLERFELSKGDLVSIEVDGKNIDVKVIDNYGDSILVDFETEKDKRNVSRPVVIKYDDVVAVKDRKVSSLKDIVDHNYKNLYNF